LTHLTSIVFAFETASLARKVSATSATVDWVPLADARWQQMVGLRAEGSMFGTPIESSVSWFCRHRFEQVQMRITEQRGSNIRVIATIAGDVDRFGVDAMHLDDWLRFDGIRVSLSDRPADADAARSALAEFTDPTGLVARGDGQNWDFAPITA